ncbi:MAG: hypothetical protein ACQERK_07885 [Campylobacterota bacterium]
MSLRLQKDDVNILLRSIVSTELSKQNSTYFPLYPNFWGRGELTASPFGLDSLSLVSLATTVGDYFGVTHSGLEENFIRYRDLVSWVDIVCDSLDEYNEGITFSTSGTTGKPKKVFHSMQSLEREAAYLAKLLQGAKSINAFVRPHHIYGFLYSIILPKFMNLQVSWNEPLPAKALFETPKDALLISTPALYDVISKKQGSFHPGITAVSSTQQLQMQTKDKLFERGIENIIEIYGSSQSLGVGYRRGRRECFTLFDYLNKSGLHDIQDNLEWENDREFLLRDRLDAQIKHRGLLVDLKQYQKQVSQMDGIEECDAVFNKGELTAFITPADKKRAMQSIATMQAVRPDNIVWIE